MVVLTLARLAEMNAKHKRGLSSCVLWSMVGGGKRQRQTQQPDIIMSGFRSVSFAISLSSLTFHNNQSIASHPQCHNHPADC